MTDNSPEEPLDEDVLDEESIDFAVTAYREEGMWVVSVLPPRSAVTMSVLEAALRRLPGEGGAFGFVGIGDEYFVAVRTKPGGVRAMVSDGGVILDWPMAQDAMEAIGLDFDDDELEDFSPFGDLSLFADFGVDADELTLICEDEDLYPEDQVRAIAKRLGFGREINDVLRAR